MYDNQTLGFALEIHSQFIQINYYFSQIQITWLHTSVHCDCEHKILACEKNTTRVWLKKHCKAQITVIMFEGYNYDFLKAVFISHLCIPEYYWCMGVE